MPMEQRRIRLLAVCVFREGDRILVGEGHDPIKGETFYRPLGGGIEFGETSADALAREIREELDAEVADLRYLGTLENVFTYAGQPGHELLLVYDGRFADPTMYQHEPIAVRDDAGSLAYWKSLDFFARGEAPLYPLGLLELLGGTPDGRRPAFQNKVQDLVDAFDLRTGVEARLLDLQSEVGEVAKEALKATRYGREPFSPTSGWRGELADVFFALACLANATSVDLETALDEALAKYRARLAARGDAGSGR